MAPDTSRRNTNQIAQEYKLRRNYSEHIIMFFQISLKTFDFLRLNLIYVKRTLRLNLDFKVSSSYSY